MHLPLVNLSWLMIMMMIIIVVIIIIIIIIIIRSSSSSSSKFMETSSSLSRSYLSNFLLVVWPVHGGGYTWRQSLWFCHKKFNSLNFSSFFLRFFQLSHHLCEHGKHGRFSLRTGDMTQQQQKITSPIQAKNCLCSFNQKGVNSKGLHTEMD